MTRRRWTAAVVAALITTPAAVGQELALVDREGVRLPILGPDREPIDMLRHRPEQVERLLEERERRSERERQVALTDALPALEEGGSEGKDRAPPSAADMVSVERIWLGESAPGQGTVVAEVELTNRSERAHNLISVYTDAAEEAVLHVTQQIAGVRQVQRLRAVHLPAEGRVELRAGGPQLLLVDLRRPLTRGEAISVTLYFEDGSRKTVKAPVASTLRGS